jgi:hypothetical protein
MKIIFLIKNILPLVINKNNIKAICKANYQ